MGKILSCRDVGVDCDYVARGATEEEILAKAAEHGRSAHGMKEIPADILAKARAAIREEKC